MNSHYFAAGGSTSLRYATAAAGSRLPWRSVVGGTVTLNAALSIGTLFDRVYVSSTSTIATATDQFINDPLTPYPALPLLDGVSPVTVYQADAYAQIQPPQALPITAIGRPLQLAPPIEVAADSLGILLPAGAESEALQQDATMGTASLPRYGGNQDEIGRKKAASNAGALRPVRGAVLSVRRR